MKPWNTWVAWLGCAGLCLALVGCGGSNVPDPTSDPRAVQGTLPSAEPPVPVVTPSSPAPAPAAAPAPAPGAGPGGRTRAYPPETATPAAPAATEPPPAQPKPEEAAGSKPAESVAPPPPGAPAATSGPGPAASADAKAKVDNNPFAVFSETQASSPAAASPAPAAAAPATGAAVAGAAAAAAEVPPPDVPPADAPPAADGNQGPLGFLEAAAANRGIRKFYTNPQVAAMTFLTALKAKDLNKVAQATALRAATESKNQKLFQLILSQELAQEDLDELAKKLSGFQVTGSNVPKSTGIIGITVTKSEGTSILRRNLTMRHEKAGWKVQDIGGEGELEKPIIMPRMGGRGGGHRR